MRQSLLRPDKGRGIKAARPNYFELNNPFSVKYQIFRYLLINCCVRVPFYHDFRRHSRFLECTHCSDEVFIMKDWRFYTFCFSIKIRINLLSAQTHSNTLKQFVGNLPSNCLIVLDHFLGLALKGLK